MQKYANVVALCQRLKAIKSGSVKILLLPYLNRVDQYATASQDTDRTSVNNSLATNYASFATAYAPTVEQRAIYLAASPRNSSLFPDGVHLSGAAAGGAAVLAELVSK